MGKDSRFENISSSVVTISNEKSPLNEIGFENATVSHAPTSLVFRERGKKIAGKADMYQVKNFNYGLIVPAEGVMGSIGMRYDASMLAAMAPTFGAGDSIAAANRGLDEHKDTGSEGRWCY